MTQSWKWITGNPDKFVPNLSKTLLGVLLHVWICLVRQEFSLGLYYSPFTKLRGLFTWSRDNSLTRGSSLQYPGVNFASVHGLTPVTVHMSFVPPPARDPKLTLTSQFFQKSQHRFFPDSRLQNKGEEKKIKWACVFQKAGPLKKQNQPLFSLSGEIMTSQAVLDHLVEAAWRDGLPVVQHRVPVLPR